MDRAFQRAELLLDFFKQDSVHVGIIIINNIEAQIHDYSLMMGLSNIVYCQLVCL